MAVTVVVTVVTVGIAVKDRTRTVGTGVLLGLYHLPTHYPGYSPTPYHHRVHHPVHP